MGTIMLFSLSYSMCAIMLNTLRPSDGLSNNCQFLVLALQLLEGDEPFLVQFAACVLVCTVAQVALVVAAEDQPVFVDLDGARLAQIEDHASQAARRFGIIVARLRERTRTRWDQLCFMLVAVDEAVTRCVPLTSTPGTTGRGMPSNWTTLGIASVAGGGFTSKLMVAVDADDIDGAPQTRSTKKMPNMMRQTDRDDFCGWRCGRNLCCWCGAHNCVLGIYQYEYDGFVWLFLCAYHFF